MKTDKNKMKLFSENVDPVVMNLLETTIQSIYEVVSPEAKVSIEEKFGEGEPKIQYRIKTFEDACKILDINPDDIPEPEIRSVSSAAFYKLVIINRALNGFPVTVKPGDIIWFPYFVFKEKYTLEYSGVRNKQPVYNGTIFFEEFPTSLCCKSRELAEYFGKQFIEHWEYYLLF